MTRTVTAEGGSVKRARAERAEIEVRARANGETPEAARASASDRAATIRTNLPDDCEPATGNLRVIDEATIFDFDGEAPYQATERLVVAVSVEDVQPVATAVTRAGGTIESLQFTVPSDTRQTLENEALAEAIEQARRKAEAIATAEGDVITDLESATTTDSGFMNDIIDDALESTPGAVFETPHVEISAEVEATFVLDRQ